MSKKLHYLVTTLAILGLVMPAIAADPGKGYILIEEWLNTGGAVTDNVDTLHTYINAGNPPTRSYWATEMDRPDGGEDNWGDRMRGYVYPPQTGDYTFWTVSDDDSEVWLSTNEDPANVKMICNVEGWTDYQNWAYDTGSPGTTYKSSPIRLEAGKRYYVEVYHSDGTGGGCVSVGWGGPGIGAGPVLVAGKYLAAFIRSPEPMFMASEPSPADGGTGVLIPILTWTAGGTSVFHDVYFGDTADPPLYKRLTFPMLYYPIPLEPGKTYYWKVNEVESDKTTIHEGTVWSFTTAPLAAFGPSPADGWRWADPNSDLEWQPGADAMAHDVYFGTDKDLVAARDASVKVGDRQVLPIVELPTLEAGTTYYWLVDEYDSMDEIHEGEVWSFTIVTPSAGIKGEYFTNTALSGEPFLVRTDSGIDFYWNPQGEGFPGTGFPEDNFSVRWTAVLESPVSEPVTFRTGADDGARLYLDGQLLIDDWDIAAGHDLAWHSSAPIDLVQGQTYLLVAEFFELGGEFDAHLRWSSKSIPDEVVPAGPLQLPLAAIATNPRNGDVNVPQDITLMWSAGEKAVSHNIYFGEDEAAVAAADASVFKGNVPLETNTFSPGVLEWNKTYYWRVDEVNTADSDSPWAGGVWKFTTADFIVVDDFESYTDDVGNRIFQTWIDGWGFTEPAPGNPGNGTGSTVGYANAPFSEHGTVHGGGSSMPFEYNNADSPSYSETERTFDSPQNWTVNGINTLCLYVQGYPQPTSVAVTETGGKMNLTGDGADIWGTSDEFTYAYKTLNGDGSIVAKVTSVGTGSNTWAKGGVMIRDSLNGNSASAQMCLTGSAGNGATFQNRASTGLDMAANDATSNVTATTIIAPPYWVKIERNADTFTGYLSPDGVGWTMLGSAEVPMTAPVYIGICVTSHAAGEDRTFQFESIKTTGSVTGAWQGAIIDSPTYNSAQDLYVAIQDSSNKTAVVSDATAVNAATWTQVLMPLSSFTGVNMTKVTKMYIGVGNRNSPVADGNGKLFIDDIRVIKQ
jgi:hypothetical protein